MSTPDVLVIGGGATGAGVLRDLAMRGLRGLLVDKADLVTGTTGRYHGLLHSGARYVAKDASAARECIAENRILRRIAAPAIEDTGGYFVQTPDDPDDYVDAFPGACAASGVDCEEVGVDELRRLEPNVNPLIRRAFRVPDASLEPWMLAEANFAAARARGSAVRPYHEVVAFDRDGTRIVGARLRDVRSGTVERIPVGFVISAAGAWAGRVAALAGADLTMSPGKGSMLIFNQRMTDACINRCHKPADGDIMVPVGTVAILGTTEVAVDDPDDYDIDRSEVEELLDEGEKLFPGLRRARLLRAYAGVRPLYDPQAAAGGDLEDSREISRSHVVVDHGPRDGIDNFVSIVGGKVTTYRLMAEDTVDVAAGKLGVTARCRTADEPLPWAGSPTRYHWLGERLAEHEARGGGDADLICECELVTSHRLRRLLDERWPVSLDDVRRVTRLGMGPCQGGFCTFRGAGMIAERAATRTDDVVPAALGGGVLPEIVDHALADFLRERHKGTRPIAFGRQLQEWAFVTALHWGTLGAGSLLPARADGAGARAAEPTMALEPIAVRPATSEPRAADGTLGTSPSARPSAPHVARPPGRPTADVVVVGAGLAGLATALELTRRGARVMVLAKGHAATHWTGASLDVAAPPGARTIRAGIDVLAATPDHPYAFLDSDVEPAVAAMIEVLDAHGLPYVGGVDTPIRPQPTGIGATRRGAILPDAQAAALSPWSTDERLIVCGIGGFKDLWPHAVAASLGRPDVWAAALTDGGGADGGSGGLAGLAPAAVVAATARLPEVEGRRNLTALHLARLFDDPAWRARALDAIARAVDASAGSGSGPVRVALPAVLGLRDHAAALAEARMRLPGPVFELPLVPPSIPGLRLYDALRAAVRSAGARIQLGESVSRVEVEDGAVRLVATPAAVREFRVRTEALVLATGGLTGGGIAGRRDGWLEEAVLGLPVDAPPRDEWFTSDPFDARRHPIESSGIRTDASLRPIGRDDGDGYLNVRVVGSLLGGQRWLLERCGDGVALASARRAAQSLAGEVLRAESPLPATADTTAAQVRASGGRSAGDGAVAAARRLEVGR